MPPTSPPSPVALVPLRTGGKSRLQGTLDAARRADLVLAMLDDVLHVLRTAGLVDIRLLAGDAGAASAAADRGLTALLDPPSAALGSAAAEAHLRRAIDAGLAAVGTGCARLVVAADLPQLRAADIEAILASTADVTVVPTRGGGTALLRLARGAVIPACYGPGSAEAHLAAARSRGLQVEQLDLDGARSDIDAAADLDALDGAGPIPVGRATASFLAAPRG